MGKKEGREAEMGRSEGRNQEPARAPPGHANACSSGGYYHRSSRCAPCDAGRRQRLATSIATHAGMHVCTITRCPLSDGLAE